MRQRRLRRDDKRRKMERRSLQVFPNPLPILPDIQPGVKEDIRDNRRNNSNSNNKLDYQPLDSQVAWTAKDKQNKAEN